MTVTLLGLLSALTPAFAAPKPSLVARDWELAFEFRDPARISVVLPGDKQPTVFWYMLYTVTNETGREVLFYPQWDLVTDTLRVIHGGDNVSPTVFDAIRQRHQKQYPFLVEPLKASGPLLQGTDNARSSVVIFREFDPDAAQFTVFVAGLSGEVSRVANPAFNAKEPESAQNPQFFTLRKSLAIRYDMPGDLASRKSADPIRAGREWVMR
jgi:hypothetical protein